MKKTLTRAFLPSMLAGCLAATSAYAQPPLPDSPEWDRYQSIESDRYQDNRYERDRYERDQYDRDRYERDRYQNQRYQGNRYESQPTSSSPAQNLAPYVATKLFLMNQKEVALSRIGQQRAESPEVRRLAERMAQDHQNIVSQLEDLMDPRLVDFLTIGDHQSGQRETRYYRGAMQESEMQMQGSEQSRMTQEERQRGSDYIDMQRQQGERFFNDSPPDAQNFNTERESYRRTTESESFRQSPTDPQNLDSDAQSQSPSQPQSQDPNDADSDSSDQEDSTPDSNQPEASSDDDNGDSNNESSPPAATPQTQGVSFLQDESEDQPDDRSDDSDSSVNQDQTPGQAQNQPQAQSGNQAQSPSRTQAQSQSQRLNQAQDQSRDSSQAQDRSSMQSQQQRLQQDDRFRQDRQQFRQQDRSFESQQRLQQDDDQQYQQQFSQRRSYDEEWSNQRPDETGLVVELIKVNQRAARQHLEMSKRSLQEYAGEGQDFDMAFVGMAIAAHMHMIAELDAIQDVESSELRRVVQQTRSVAQEHLDQAKRLAQRLQDREYDAGEAPRAGSREQGRDTLREQDRRQSRTIRDRQSDNRRIRGAQQDETRVNRPIINQQFESEVNENPVRAEQTGSVTERADNRDERQERDPDQNQD